MRLLITGCAGFIGFHLSKKICENKKNTILGIDNINNYYDIGLKKDRLKILKKNKNFFFTKLDITDFARLKIFFVKNKFDIVIHLAAQAGVRYSIDYPETYVSSNLVGFYNIIENSRLKKIKNFLYASTSSVYGNQKKFPINETANTDLPLSFYAATKKSNEVMAYSYYNIYGFKSIALRFFTVYGPYGRPDMSLFKFTKAIYENKKIELYNYGKHIRDFTYISDVVNAIYLILKINNTKFEIFNISSSNPQPLLKFLKIIEKNIGKKAKIKNKVMQLGSRKIKKFTGFVPSITIEKGVSIFIKWYKNYYKINE